MDVDDFFVAAALVAPGVQVRDDVKLQVGGGVGQALCSLQHDPPQEDRPSLLVGATHLLLPPQERVEVPDVPPLAGDGDPPPVSGPGKREGGQGLLHVGHLPAAEQEAADHGAGAALPGLAVHGGDVALVLREPLLDVPAELVDDFELGRAVVRHGVAGQAILKQGGRVLGACGELGTEIVDLPVIMGILVHGW